MSNSAAPRSPEEEALWDAIVALQKELASLRQELNQHYSNHNVASNASID